MYNKRGNMRTELTGQMLKQLRDEKEAIDTTIATLEDLLRKQDQASRRTKEQPKVGKTKGPRAPEKQQLR